MHLVAMAVAFKSLANEYGGKVGENECLDEGNQYLDHVNEHGKCQ